MQQLITSLSSKAVALVLALTLLLLLSFKTESLWTDEAFSAFIACHSTFSALWQTLLAGDSSDLQMWLYYSYLHCWVSLFGKTEFALRSANIPFIVIFSAAIVWIRINLFRSSWVWLAVLSPFAWAYAGDARPYMTIVALSTVSLACLLAVISEPRYATSRTLPFVGLGALLVGLNMHMLMILLIPPGVVLFVVYRWASGTAVSARPWVRAALLLSPGFLAYFAFLAWTFKRGTSYDYLQPQLLSMASVLFRFLGLAGYAPNRHYDVPLTHYLFGMVAAALGFLAAAVFTIWPAVRAGQARTLSLLAALVAGIGEAFVLSFVFKQQIEVRHLACLFTLLVFLLFSGWDFHQKWNLPGTAMRGYGLAALAVAIIWMVSDFRLTFVPEYRREDFQAAVPRAMQLARNGPIAVVADPAAVAYYGLSVKGNSPCFPLPGTCETALSPLRWPTIASGSEATFWTAQEIEKWLDQDIPAGQNKVLLISRSRHPMYLRSIWWALITNAKAAPPIAFHGFFVYSFRNKY